MSDQQWMQRAIALAAKGRFTTRPNPAVGCVIVNNDQMVGEGYHQMTGGPHAEVYALDAAGAKAKGATAYVTLEPCSHQGRTPPCVKALINAQVTRVVIAMQDPNPKVSGRGIAMLRDAGIEVEVGVESEAAAALNVGFLHAMVHERPYVRLKVASSIDGATAMTNGESQWITGAEARQDVQYLRARCGAIITGIGTVLADDPQLTVRTADWPELPAQNVPQPLRVIVDSHARIPLEANILHGGDVWLACTAIDDAKYSDLTAKGVRVMCFPGYKQVPLGQLLTALYHAQVYDVMVEAGCTLSGAFLAQGLVNELWHYQAPIVLGDQTQNMFHLPELTSLQDKIALQFVQQYPVGQDWCRVYTL